MSDDTVTIDRELFEWLVEYAIELQGQRHYQGSALDGTRRRKEYDQLRRVVQQAVAIRDGVQKEGEG